MSESEDPIASNWGAIYDAVKSNLIDARIEELNRLIADLQKRVKELEAAKG